MQFSHRSQPLCTSTATRSPTLNSSTPGPRAATVPAYSWPMMNSPSGWPASVRWSTLTSVEQMDATVTLSSTSPGPGSGTGRCSTRMSSAPWRTTALIAETTGINRLLENGASASLLELVQLRQQLVVRDELSRVVEDLLEAEDTRLVDDQIGALGVAVETAVGVGVQNPVGLERLPRDVADERERQPQLLAPRRVRHGEVRADTHDLGITAFELGKIQLESRHLSRSSRREGADETEEDHVPLALELVQGELLRGRRGQGELGGPLPDLEGGDRCGRADHEHDDDRREHREDSGTFHRRASIDSWGLSASPVTARDRALPCRPTLGVRAPARPPSPGGRRRASQESSGYRVPGRRPSWGRRASVACSRSFP